jgi:hypothetical protein
MVILPMKKYESHFSKPSNLMLAGIIFNDSLFHTDLIYYITLEQWLETI